MRTTPILRMSDAWWCALLALLVLLSACGGGQPTVIKGNRYVMSGTQAEAQSQCSAQAPSRKWAVVVGVNFYKDERIPDLGGAVNDAWSFYHFLASPQGGAVDPFRLRLLLNEEATKQGVEDALGQFLQYACPQDQIIIYFAGHGAPEPDRPEEAFLLVHDTSLDSMVSTAISMTQLPNFLQWRAGNTGRLLMLIDACHSGNIEFPGSRGFKTSGDPIVLEGEMKEIVEERAKSVTGSLEEVVKGNPGWGAISSTAADQLAGETTASCIIGGKPYAGGIFTCYMLEGLSGVADANGDRDVTLGELFDHLIVQVSQARDGDQVPQRSGQLEDGLVLANTRGVNIDIPRVPERYLVETQAHPLRPYIYASAGLTVAALATSGFFNLMANNTAQRMNDFDNISNPRSEFEDLQDTRDRQILMATTGYITTAALAAITLGALSFDLLSDPEDINDVYEDSPWFQIGLSPTPGGASLQLKVDY